MKQRIMEPSNKGRYLIRRTGFLLAFFIFHLFSAPQSVLAGPDFVDVDVTHPHFQAIRELADIGVLDGYRKNGERFFLGSQRISRAEAVKISLLSAQFEPQVGGTPAFDDTPADAWFTPWINTAREENIVTGFLDGSFHPAALVSRAEAITMLCKAFSVPLNRAEISAEKWYVPYLNWATNYRVLVEEDQIQAPHELITRSEMVELAYRIQQLSQQNFTAFYTFIGSGEASFYNEGFAGRRTANGEIYDPTALTAAHRTFPFGTRVKVWKKDHPENFVVVRINDRGPYYNNRLLDLSQAAFERLAPASRGVIPVNFSVVQTAYETSPALPEFLKEEIEDNNKFRLPEVIQTALEAEFLPPQIYSWYQESVAFLAEETFPGVTLRYPIERTILPGTVLPITGKVKADGHQKITAWLRPAELGSSEQDRHFSAEISGQDFFVPVLFDTPGEFYLGVSIDDQRQITMVPVTVKPPDRYPKFLSSDDGFDQELFVTLDPEAQTVGFAWDNAEYHHIARLRFTQSAGNQRDLYFERGVNRFDLPYEWLRAYDPNLPLKISLALAKSRDGTVLGQQKNWEQTDQHQYRLVAGFPEFEQEAQVKIFGWKRFVRPPEILRVRGQRISAEKLEADAFVILPDGTVRSTPLSWSEKYFSLEWTPKQEGAYIFELVSERGLNIFSRAIYWYQDRVLPILPWPQTPVMGSRQREVLDWINRVREPFKLSALGSSATLNNIAQAYAERMVRERFLGHTDPQGRTLEDRVREEGLVGKFGENISFGSNLELALHGLENSGSHRQTILGVHWQRAGIGVAQNRQGDFYIVQVFSDQ